jgi:hypothetical protein
LTIWRFAPTSATGGSARPSSPPNRAGHRSWDCTAGDPDEWHYLQVIGVDLEPFAGLPPEDIEVGIERFGATLPAADRLRRLINFNPLRIDRHGIVRR